MKHERMTYPQLQELMNMRLIRTVSKDIEHLKPCMVCAQARCTRRAGTCRWARGCRARRWPGARASCCARAATASPTSCTSRRVRSRVSQHAPALLAGLLPLRLVHAHALLALPLRFLVWSALGIQTFFAVMVWDKLASWACWSSKPILPAAGVQRRSMLLVVVRPLCHRHVPEMEF